MGFNALFFYEFLQLSELGTWVENYRPSKIRVTFTGATNVSLVIADINGDIIAEVGNIGNYIYTSGTEVELDFVTYGEDINFLGMIAANGNIFSITNIEFLES